MSRGYLGKNGRIKSGLSQVRIGGNFVEQMFDNFRVAWYNQTTKSQKEVCLYE